MLPELKNGDTTPDSGIAPSTPPEISSISNAISAAKPERQKQCRIQSARQARCAIRARIRKTNSSSDRGDAGEAPLFADRGKHQVRVARRNHRRIAESRTRSTQAAGRERPQRVRQLVAAAHVVVPGREPHVDTRSTTVVRLADAIADRNAGDQHHRRRASQPGASARDREHGQKQEAGDQRRAEVLQHEKHQPARTATAIITGRACCDAR